MKIYVNFLDCEVLICYYIYNLAVDLLTLK